MARPRNRHKARPQLQQKKMPIFGYQDGAGRVPMLSKAESGMRTTLRYRHIVMLWAAILTAATVARLTTWWEVFTPDRVRFMADTDSHYHVLRALRIVENFPSIAWTDAAMNHPL